MMARYHLFQPHCIAGVYYEPGIVDLPTSMGSDAELRTPRH